ncbi:P-loop containing nucleoside triphosphate hydrolase protein [Pseudomassariella vexata]|uniref:RNA helicase n=1 Tax=Pseudomassariella vexata TaxID=1141098 RepID=A0A1Y2DAR0_9PEZI|nr:P-loop containing nucleoside triphosphate hydrolase protein [Pseudomassariella vexata]ORY56363.1 P-loop containing nucleoside triphosphate hydrolase protein [Pseudomassariella vexata]
MSKHTLEEAEIEADVPRKKSKKDKKSKKEKVPEVESGVEAPAEDAMDIESEVKKEKKKRDKKEKKEKKEKQEKKKGSKRPIEDEDVNGVEEEAEVKKDKKDKKEKKQKKDKKPKTEDAEASAEANGTTNGHAKLETSGDAAASTSTPATTMGKLLQYEQTAALAAVPKSEIKSFLSKNLIVISDPLSSTNVRPITQFAYLPTTTLTSKSPFKGFKEPTPIQAASWPFGLSSRDIVGVAETGSGKTIAFGLPLVEAVIKMPKAKGPGRIRAVVVSPTRELAMQTNEQFTKLANVVGLKVVCVYGGASKDAQRTLLRKADIIVATPGRLKDFLEEGEVKLDNAGFVVLDEADRMLDTGFEEDIKRIIGCCKPKDARQTLMFTATWPQSVQALALTFMNDPVRIQIGGNESGDLQANLRISQTVEVVDPRGKEQRVLQLLKAQPKNERVLVFCLYKKEATRVETFLGQRGIKVVAIHGDLRQEQRTRSLEAFKDGSTPVLVATDVAARGLDIPEVKLVINVTFPLTIEDYVHRIGRTGRAGKTGVAITLFTEHDKAHSGELINILKAAGQPIPDELMKFGTTVKKKQHGTYGAFFKDVDMTKKGTKITFDD